MGADTTASPRSRSNAPLIRRFALTGIGLSILTFALIFAYYQSVRGVTIADAFSRVQPSTLLAAVGLHLAAHIAWSLRFASVARGVGSRFRLWSAFRLVVAGNFAAAITPARIGGEALRLYLLDNRPDMPGHPARTVAADRALDIVFFVGAGLVAIPLVPVLIGPPSATFAILGVVGVLLFSTALAGLVILVIGPQWIAPIPDRIGALVGRFAPKRAPRLAAKLRRAGREARLGMLHLMRKRPRWLAAALLLTALTWLLEFGVLWVLLRGFGYDVPYLVAFVAGAVLTILSTVVVIPGGSGAVEVTGLALFAAVAGSSSPALVLLWRATTFYYDILVGGIVAFTFVTPGQLELIVEEAREEQEQEEEDRQGQEPDGPSDPAVER